MSPPKQCAVCGDKALGYNFNAVTCESCKAFFRRNALAKKQFTCPFNQNCEITTITRRFCQKCRLKKCLDIGMKSENIMSEEDKLVKRRKIESNRVKRRLKESHKGGEDASELEGVVKQERKSASDIAVYDGSSAYDSQQSNGSFDSGHSGSGTANQCNSSTTSPASSHWLGEPLREVNPELMTGEEMVDFIVADADRASQAISRLMRTPSEALFSLERILNSQKDALKLISHLIAYPGDALKIISKIINSPFDALTVFTKFMSSPTDALEIISKVVSSPQDVLQFIRNLMDSPEDALDIMNKFMNTPAEALRTLNKILNGANASSSNAPVDHPTETATANELQPAEDELPRKETFQNESSLDAAASIGREPTLIQSMLDANTVSSPNALLPHSMSMASGSPLSVVMSPEMVGYQPSTPKSFHYSDSSKASTLDMLSPDASSPNQFASHHQAPQLNSSPLTVMGSDSNEMATAAAVASASDFADEHFDIKSFIQNSFPDNASNGYDSINSLESVLTEVIRIEYEAFSNLPQEPRVKQEQQYPGQLLTSPSEHQYPSTSQDSATGFGGHGGCLGVRQPIQPLCSPTSSLFTSRELNEAEQMKLRELKIASEALFDPVDEDLSLLMMGDERIKPEVNHQDPKLLQVINLTAVAIKRLIKMSKKITAFRDMCQEDQVALLKGGCTEMMLMRSAMTYDNDRDTWKIPHAKEDMSNIRAEVLKLAKGNLYEEHLKFFSTFDGKWRMDENIILIMCAIVLFTPTRPRIIHSDVIRLEQNSYYYLLRRYLDSKYPGCEAKSAFIKLIKKISDVERLNQCIIGVYLNVNPSQVEPLLREIFDLKNQSN